MLRGKIIIDLERRFGARLENEKLFECLGAYDLEFDLSLSKFFYLLPKDYRVLTLLPIHGFPPTWTFTTNNHKKP